MMDALAQHPEFCTTVRRAKQRMEEQADAINRLPEEMMRMVLDAVENDQDHYSARTSLKKLRLVNKKFSRATSPRLFRDVSLWIGIDSIERLTKISEHPQLSYFVEHITFSPLRFIEHPEGSAYWKEVRDWFEWGQSFSLNDFAIGSGRHFAAHVGFIAAQRFLYHDDTAIKLLVRCFKRLNNFTSVSVDYGNKFIGAADVVRSFGRMRGDEISRNCDETLVKLREALHRAEIRPRKFRLGDFDEGCYRAAHEIRIAFPVFQPQNDDYSLVSGAALANTFRKNDHSHGSSDGKALFEHLEEFHTSHMMFETSSSDHLSYVRNALEGVIESTTALRKLTLGCLLDAYALNIRLLPRLFLGDVADFMYLRNLVELNVSGFLVTESNVLRLMHYLAITGNLRVAKFSSVQMHGDESWATALEKTRDLEFPCLKAFILSFCGVTDVYRTNLHVEDYLLHKTDVNPLEVTEEDDDA